MQPEQKLFCKKKSHKEWNKFVQYKNFPTKKLSKFFKKYFWKKWVFLFELISRKRVRFDKFEQSKHSESPVWEEEGGEKY